MVSGPRYIIDRVDTNGSVTDSSTYRTQREMVEAYPETFTQTSVREFFRTKSRVKVNEDARLEKYKGFRVRRYNEPSEDAEQTETQPLLE